MLMSVREFDVLNIPPQENDSLNMNNSNKIITKMNYKIANNSDNENFTAILDPR